MALLDLPIELFTPIMVHVIGAIDIHEAFGYVTGTIDTYEAFGYRLVCKTFDAEISAHFIKRACNFSFAQIFRNRQLRLIFKHCGAAILNRKISRPLEAPERVALSVEKCVTWLLNHGKATGQRIESTPDQVKSLLCNVIMATDRFELEQYLTGNNRLFTIEPWPALMLSLVTAAGDIKTLKEELYLPYLLQTNCDLFPNALGAAVATNQLKALKVMLGYLATNVRGKAKSGSWQEMRSAARVIGGALRIAIRLHRTDAGLAIFSFFAKHKAYRNSTSLCFEEQLVNDCMRHGNVGLIYASFVYKYTGVYDPQGSVCLGKTKISPKDELFLLLHGQPSALRAVIEHGLLDPNRCDQGVPPLHFALDKRKYNMARVLLSHGASIDFVPSRAGGESALSRAVRNGHFEDLRFLLTYGDHADPSLRAKRPKAYSLRNYVCRGKCRFLLEKFECYGKDYLERPDLWDIYTREHKAALIHNLLL